jgi:hypothetical protein
MIQTLPDLKGTKDSSGIRIGHSRLPLSIADGAAGQNINKETKGLNSTIRKLDLKRPPPNNSRIHIFFKST